MTVTDFLLMNGMNLLLEYTGRPDSFAVTESVFAA